MGDAGWSLVLRDWKSVLWGILVVVAWFLCTVCESVV